MAKVNGNAMRFPEKLVGVSRGRTAHVADAAGRESGPAARPWLCAQAASLLVYVDLLGDGSHDLGFRQRSKLTPASDTAESQTYLRPRSVKRR
ncbi:hypothetical protein SKAU_G00163020 [Synaphobranchus kaupii]|uniref:Uncharacterized protein n=1 Tax=Synaphobranchus kaupii TaxID=118154 RepID=A0A9Q1J029_SYNKA|nr:hypothetical protein SKAU_G00163020 [Synaphobranchus kaupii]